MIKENGILSEVTDADIQLLNENPHEFWSGITEIGDRAFMGCTGLNTIAIPYGVTTIGCAAFRGCISLTEVIIPDSVTKIDGGAFMQCTGLIQIELPGGLIEMGTKAFMGCTGLTKISIPDGVVKIPSRAFSGCVGLTEITIPDSVLRIGDDVFSGISKVSINNEIMHGDLITQELLDDIRIKNHPRRSEMVTIQGLTVTTPNKGTFHYESLDEIPIAGEEDKPVLREIDRRFKMLGSESVESLRISADGVADLSKGYYIHGIPVSTTNTGIESRRKFGLTCSEYFGKPESAEECRYCLAVTKTNDVVRDSVVNSVTFHHDSGRDELEHCFASVIPEVGFIIDNSVTHRTDTARQLNFFEYKRDKAAFIKKYNATEEEVEILETIDKNSVNAERIVSGYAREWYEKFNWAAITGGVPPQFVVGIVVNSKLIKDRSTNGGKIAIEESTFEENFSKALETARVAADIFGVPVLDDTGRIIYHAKENVLGEE